MSEGQTILQRVARGDPAAVRDCVKEYGDLVWSLARRFLRDADAEDAVQDVYIDLWNSAARFDPRIATETAFVATIARRRLIDRVRQRARRPKVTSLDDEETGGAWEPAVAPQMEEESDAAVVAGVLGAMAPGYREILSLSLYEGYTHSEIAERLDLPIGTVKTRIRRGLMHIREQLGIDAAGEADL